MNIRKTIEDTERLILSSKARLSLESLGREKNEADCPIRTVFMRDRDRIIHSEAFRRLRHKTQVFFTPKNDLFRTRLTHTLEVSQISRTISKALKLNEDLTEAIALGHDLGHSPFGHTGEKVLDELSPIGFHHARQSYRIVDFIEKGGMNLTVEVKDGILKHSKRGGTIVETDTKKLPITLEGEIVRVCDRIAYLNHDLDDALRADIIKFSDIPQDIIKFFGETHGKRINTIITDLVENSLEKDHITFSEEIAERLDFFKDFMYEKVYLNPVLLEESKKSEKIIRKLFDFFINNMDIVERKMSDVVYPYEETIEIKIVDYIAMMTDDFALACYEKYIN